MKKSSLFVQIIFDGKQSTWKTTYRPIRLKGIVIRHSAQPTKQISRYLRQTTCYSLCLDVSPKLHVIISRIFSDVAVSRVFDAEIKRVQLLNQPVDWFGTILILVA